jgi:hypothetical protein
MNFDNRLFVDSGVSEPLPPLYKGAKVKFWPGQMVRHSSKGQSTSYRRLKKTGLRRYVFRYENGKFVYLATRKGQRNGGFNSKPSQTTIRFELTTSTTNYINYFALLSGSNLTSFYKGSENSNIKYNTNLTRWEWSTRPTLTAAFVPQAFSDSTINILRNAGGVNEVAWTFIENAYTTATPQVPAFAAFYPVEWFNNNSIENLNRWPIKNIDANYDHVDPNVQLPWQKGYNGSVVPDNRIEGLTDEYLHRCFQGIYLKNYSTIFVEVVWRFRMNKAQITSYSQLRPPTYRNSSWGYWDRIHDQEWWSPKPFYGHIQKGRVYRIGILEENTGVDNFDKVLWAQRTRIITTRRTRGGRTVLD